MFDSDLKKPIKGAFGVLVLCLAVALLTGSSKANAQSIKLSGRLIDASSRQPLSFATVFLTKSKQGTSTDEEGNYLITSSSTSDSVIFSSVGYTPAELPVLLLMKERTVTLQKATIELSDVTILSGENPANALVRDIIRNKAQHDKDNLASYHYQVYNQLEFDLNNVSDKLKSRKLLKPFAVAFENMDSSGHTLPLLLSETLSDFYYQKNPPLKKEIIQATKISGVKNESSSQFLGAMYQDINIYSNFINLFNLSFVSPFNNNAFFYYQYYLLDSSMQNGEMSYKLKFKPKRPSESTFQGTFWVNTSGYAITQIDMTVNPKANVNFVDKLHVEEEFTLVAGQYWMLKNDSVIMHFKMPKRVLTVTGKKFTTYQDFQVNSTEIANNFQTKRSIEYDKGVLSKSDDYWNAHRPVTLSSQQENVYSVIDSIQRTSSYKTYYAILNSVGTGYWTHGNFEIGPFYNFYSASIPEGNRFRFGGRTSNAFSTKLMIYGYGAYGTLDESWKYNGGFLYMLGKTPRQTISFDALNDFEFSGDEFNDFGSDNAIATLMRRDVPQKYARVERMKATYEKEWNTGFSGTISFQHATVLPYFNYSFIPAQENTQLKNDPITVSEMDYTARFAYQEKFYTGEFLRTSMGSKYPIVEVEFATGVKNVWNSEFTYQKIGLDISDKFRFHPFGETQYEISAGKIFGTLPSPALYNARGNETYYYNSTGFNGMNNYEFLTDRYVSAFVTQHLGGFIFNKIPGLKMLKWRTVVEARALWGNMSAANRVANQNTDFIVPSGLPYVETGAGVENIFRIIRVDAFWRLTYLDEPDAIPFGVRASLQVSF